MKQADVAKKTATSRQNIHKKAKILEAQGLIKDRKDISENELHHFESNQIKKIEQPNYEGELLDKKENEEGVDEFKANAGNIKKLQHWILEDKKYSALKKKFESGKLELEKEMQAGRLFPREIVFQCASVFSQTLSRELRKLDLLLENYIPKNQKKNARKGIAQWMEKTIEELNIQKQKME